MRLRYITVSSRRNTTLQKYPSHPNTIAKGHGTFKDAGQYAEKEAFLLIPASNRPPFQIATSIPEGSWEKKADSGKAFRIAENDPEYRKNKTFKIGNKSGNPADKPHNTAHQSHHTKKTSNASRQAEYSSLANEIQVRHYSPKTLKAYRGWMQKFQTFTKSKSPDCIKSFDHLIGQGIQDFGIGAADHDIHRRGNG